MSPSAKAVYEQKGVELKQKYEVDLAAFWEKASPEDIEAENKRRKTMAANGGKKLIKLKDPNAPKRPSIAYIHFVKEFVAEYASTSDNGTGGGSSVIKAGAAWNALAPEQKQKYEEMAKEDKQRYLRELEAYRNKSVY
ncbi:HMG-box [Ramicandelaber brevisporus]|nr:HMG-box [Ramicandelaber brevisporus]